VVKSSARIPYYRPSIQSELQKQRTAPAETTGTKIRLSETTHATKHTVRPKCCSEFLLGTI
jgi:hypothetical protein